MHHELAGEPPLPAEVGGRSGLLGLSAGPEENGGAGVGAGHVEALGVEVVLEDGEEVLELLEGKAERGLLEDVGETPALVELAQAREVQREMLPGEPEGEAEGGQEGQLVRCGLRLTGGGVA